MSDGHRSRRLTEAANLRESIDSLYKVDPAQRVQFIHDRIVSTVEEICTTKKRNGQPAFVREQIDALKDIAFQVVYVLDVKQQPPRTIPARLVKEFRALPAIGKIGTMAAVILFVLNVISGGLTAVEKARQLSGLGPIGNAGNMSTNAGQPDSAVRSH